MFFQKSEEKKLKEEQVLEKAIEKYGKTHQILKCIEEMSELTNELCDYLDGDENREKIIEELVDCEVMFDQLKKILNITRKERRKVRKYKVTRLETNLKEM